ncbi:GNAT family N-acetyltransferase [Actinoplanes sp. NPDC051494]|uniref:GNAT family N-acetyltransferase n=1 Tax=Actinoplanes sp. NPDC051494 TaxID=3363907 RepID=UPI0037891537
MVEARRASIGDAPELMRLRKVMLESMDDEVPDGPWIDGGIAVLRRQLGDPGDRTGVFVVDVPGGPGLAACVVGAIDQRLPNPGDPTGLRGYVYSVATDPSYRRRGFSRACMTALLQWYAQRGIAVVDLRASRDGLPLYESLGFQRTSGPIMRIHPRG